MTKYFFGYYKYATIKELTNFWNFGLCPFAFQCHTLASLHYFFYFVLFHIIYDFNYDNDLFQ